MRQPLVNAELSGEAVVSVSNALVRAARLPDVYVADGRPLPAAARDPIAPIGHDVINRTGRGHHPVVARAIGDVDPVGSRSREHGHGAAVLDDPVVAGLAVDAVVARAAVEDVVTRAAVDLVVARPAVDPVAARPPVGSGVPRPVPKSTSCQAAPCEGSGTLSGDGPVMQKLD